MTPAAERFWAKVDKAGPNGCWLWTAGCRLGYGYFYADREHTNVRAHRWAYEQLVGPIPEGLQLDHLCRVRHCVNPSHLEPVTAKENTRRSPIAPATVNANKTHCDYGHEFTEANTRIKQGRRDCLRCRRRWYRTKVHLPGSRAIGGWRMSACNKYLVDGEDAVMSTDNPAEATCRMCLKNLGLVTPDEAAGDE